jgi:hypothetical protein
MAVVAVGSAAVATAWLHAAALFPRFPFPAKQVVTTGWRELAVRVEAERAKLRAPAFVLGCGSRTASALAFYLPGRPETFSVDVLGERAPQWALWGGAEALRGREGILVLDRRDRSAGGCARREQACARLERLRPLVVRRAKQPVTTFELWRCALRR